MVFARSSLSLLLVAVCAVPVLLAFGPVAYADSSAQPTGKPSSNSALESALSACASSVAKDGSGRPERAAMDACMKAKGFEPPRGGPGGGRGGNPPPMPPSGE